MVEGFLSTEHHTVVVIPSSEAQLQSQVQVSSRVFILEAELLTKQYVVLVEVWCEAWW